MDLEIKKLREQWEYLQGGFLFLEESGNEEASGALALANGELRYYIDTLSVVDLKAKELKDELGLTDPAVVFAEVPASLCIMTDQDIAFVKEEGGTMDASYGSVALSLFYGYVSNYLKVPSMTVNTMKAYIQERAAAALPGISVQF